MKTETYGKWYRGRIAVDYKLLRLGFTQDFFSIGVFLCTYNSSISLTLFFWTIDFCKLTEIKSL